MSYPQGGYPGYGPDPWQQTSWDWRAAGNFVCGGAGCGLIVFAALANARGAALTGLMLAGLALVALGLFFVSLELGRPLRALNVFRNPLTSWMGREAWTTMLLFPAGVIAATGIAMFAWIAAVLALVFVYCQGRMLQAARGIPAWREPLIAPLFVVTALAEGGGWFFVTDALHRSGTQELLVGFGVIVLVRILVWLAYRRRLASGTVRGAAIALDRAGRALQVAGTIVPLVLVVGVATGAVSGALITTLAALAGLAAALAGAYAKYTLIVHAAFNQGFTIAHLPVRGARS
jgi:phenylacetyl-CoA:acceptor oxidoreductase subunit 2